MNQRLIPILLGVFFLLPSYGQENYNHNRFKQLKEELPTPNVYRTASGAPGHAYYQQKADYVMEVVLDDEAQKISGYETITYTNNSPDELTYLWLQLDQNVREKDGYRSKIRIEKFNSRTSYGSLERWMSDFDGGFKIEAVTDASGRDLPYVINNTMMRIDLPSTLRPGQSVKFSVKWWYNINNRMKVGGRSGYEYFEEDGNYLYTIAQFFPRMCVYNEVEGWQNKQFLGSGEFTLPFGDYRVKITVPDDHVVSATGELQNSSSVLTSEQRKRLSQARSADSPVMIVNQEEAEINEKEGSDGSKTWSFYAENVRDFAFASSRKFIWDAMGVEIGGKTVMCMSFYPKEGNPLWEQYSTEVVAHTIRSYSKYTIDYPYPVAQSVHSKWIGMEYPMICFNGGRPEEDGTYSERTKYGMISVIVHEVGHNFFPMIINSDERQWTWMDEGLNSFVQALAEQEWQKDYPSRPRPSKIASYMGGDKDNISPIMTNSESIHQFGPNAYSKPATGLMILRETIMGHELFDYAFKEYARRWAFRHPTPADFFRTMEDASAVDLDWFWRSWFYTNDHVDLGIQDIKWHQLSTRDPEIEKPISKQQSEEEPKYIGEVRAEELTTYTETKPELQDFYTTYDPFEVTDWDMAAYERFMASLSEEEKAVLNKGLNFYEMTFEMIGGVPMPIILELSYADGTEEVKRIPVEIWRKDPETVTKVFWSEKELISVKLDPYLETADTDLGNNYWPPRMVPNRFELYKQKDRGGRTNPMQRAREAEE
jgi:hypothetical protein